MRLIGLALAVTLVTAGASLCAEEAKDAVPAATPEQIQKWIGDLDSDRYQAREDATAGLLRAGYDAVTPVAEAAAQGGLEAAIRAIYVLREAALSTDSRTADAAERALQSLAEGRGEAAPRAAKTLVALAEMRRRRIRAHLATLGAKFQSTQRFIAIDPFPDYSGLWIDETWKGTEEDLAKLKLLTDITTITLEGPQVTDAWIEHVAQMPGLSGVAVKRSKITDQAIEDLKALPNLQELSVYYSPIGDGAVEHLAAMRGLTVLKLYGGQFSAEGQDLLKSAFEGTATVLDIRKGAFLGISCNAHPAGCLISYVREGSAAARAELYPNDIIVRYNGEEVEDFEELTSLIAQHAPGETTEIEILRGPATLKKKVTLGHWE
ncbi:MAG: PDZ domain-containing protein [Planctomycetes bacterium]|nr:PDZ domain-containing protein [Planctomycetota bacterium]